MPRLKLMKLLERARGFVVAMELQEQGSIIKQHARIALVAVQVKPELLCGFTESFCLIQLVGPGAQPGFCFGHRLDGNLRVTGERAGQQAGGEQAPKQL
jgi:hypothetical protein